VDQDDGVGHEHQGGNEVEHHPVGIELGQDDDPADHGLGQDARHQAAAQPDQVPPPGRAEDGGHEGQRHGDDQDIGHHPVGELNEGVELEGRGQVAGRAVGPVRASKPRPGQAHRTAGEHNEGHQGQRHLVEPMTEGGGDGKGAVSRHLA
jgi:hypothetical protein